MMQRAGFDRGNGSNFSLQTEQLPVDSTITFFAYYPTGSLDSMPLFRTHHTYPQNDRRLEQEFIYEEGTWKPTSQSLFLSDELERLIEVDAQVFDPEMGLYVPNSRINVFPRGSSSDLVDSFFVYAWNSETEAYQAIISNINEYDDQDRLLETHSVFYFFGEQICFRDVLTYDSNGDNVLTETYGVFDNNEVLVQITEKEYVNHLPIETIESVFSGIGFEPQSRTTYAYNNFGELIQQSFFELNPEIGEWMLTALDPLRLRLYRAHNHF